MSPGIEYALGAMVCFGLGDLIYKRGSAAGVKPHHLLMLQSWVFMPISVIFAYLTDTLHFTWATAWGGAAGLCMWVGFYNFAYSLKLGAVSVNAPIFRLSFIITATLAILLLGEAATRAKLAGIGLALVASWLLLGGRAQGVTAASLMRVGLATVSVGVGNLLYKVGLQHGALGPAMVASQAFVFVPLGLAFTASVDGRIRPPAMVWRYSTPAALILFAAFGLLAHSLSIGEASVVVPIAQMGFAVTAVLGFLVLHEPVTLRKVTGLLCAVIALLSFATAW